MCGVVGFSCEKPDAGKIELLQKIIIQSKIRGLHSFGYSYFEEEIKTKKRHDIKNVNLPIAKKIIYHNRYSTSGDYKDHNNNQPISNPDMSLVFNGVLDMGTKEEIENKYEISMQTDNDGEILLHKCGADKEKLIHFLKNNKGSFAGLILTSSNELLAVRNPNRPLWKLEHDNATYFASTKDIFKRVDSSFEPEQLKEYKVYEY
tara:strand:+ start:1669 stop:2280 length:612 start_codon:yes stop_codon:yes gene_type:complete